QTRQKIGIASPLICPRVSIVDIDILSCMPPFLTARTGFDVMAHVTECFVSRKTNPITDSYCLKAMELVFNYLPRAYSNGNDLEAREAMALADTYGGWALVTSRPVLPHALSHPISAFYPEIEHGVALAALTPEVMRFNIKKGDEETVSKYCQIAKAGGIKVDSFKKKEALKSVKAIKELLKKIKLDITLKDLGVEKDKFEGMVESAFATMKGPIEANPVPVDREDILNLYSKSM
ncbi:MAG: iron-containing alcohol dehydrogenase, partial [Candidatus Aerophobetes bacterium]|nr:iron-containing alcohol dehydrogenase [Candidatus Aerophobetes bacterium]